MTAPERLRQHLQGVRDKPGGGFMAECPSHSDRKASLSVDAGRETPVVIKCMAGCGTDDVLAAIGLTWEQLLAGDERKAERSIVAVYDYHSADGESLLHQTVRFRPKGFSQRRPDGQGGWLWNLQGIEPVLYRLPYLAGAAGDVWVHITEGEADADRLAELGLIATTSPMGAGKWRPSYTEALRGRRVVVLPDNDDVGRKHALHIVTALNGVAAEVKLLELAGLPEKGDVSDWLQAGGTVEELERLVEGAPTWPKSTIIEFPAPQSDAAPDVQVLAPDRVSVVQHTELGPLEFLFSDMEKNARELDAELTIRFLAAGAPTDPYPLRLNLLSLNARNEVRRELEAIYGKELKWAAVLAAAFSKAQQTFLGLDRSVRASMLEPPDRMSFLIEGILPDEGVTMPFGAGTSLKTFITMDWAICIARGLDWLGHGTQQRNVLWVDYETGQGMFGFRLRRLLQGHGLFMEDVPNIHYWPAGGMSLPDSLDALRRCIERHSIGALFVDHTAVACGGEPEKADTATRYFRAVSKLGLPAVSIAHITGEGEKEPGQILRPFGSVFWSNEARRTWFVRKATQDDGATLAEVGFFRRKVNDGPAPPDFGVHVAFEDPAGPIRVSRGDIRESAELFSGRRLDQQIYDVLTSGMRPSEIAAVLPGQHKPEVISETMRRNKRLFDCAELGGGRGKESLWIRAS